MMIALSIRLEENILRDPDKGDRTSVWFWVMMRNLGLDCMTDDCFDEDEAVDILRNFVNRNYEKNGQGGLFFLGKKWAKSGQKSGLDMRNVEIWYQANYFFSENMATF